MEEKNENREPVPEIQEEENQKMGTGRKILIGIIAVLFLLTAAAYGYGVYYFTNHFLPGSFVNGFNCSYMDQEEAETLLKKKTEAYVLAVQTRGDGQESISAGEINLAYQSDGSVKKLMHDQKRFLWFLSFGQQSIMEVPSSVSYDEGLFEQSFGALECLKDQVEPADAYIEDTGSGFAIVPEIEGNKVNEEKFRETLITALTTGDPNVNLEEDGCYVNPEIYRDDERLMSDCRQMNELTDVVITYDFGDRKETADRNVIRTWLSRNENQDLVLDSQKIAQYIKTLAEKYDTIGTQRSFVTYNSREITVSGGDYGWQIDQEKETQALFQAVTDKKTQVREPEYQKKAMSRDTNDIGYTYVEINLAAQRLVVYQEGMPVADTGIYAPAGTEPGVYAVGEMKSPGETEAGTVNYWIPYSQKLGIVDNPSLTQEAAGAYSGEILDSAILADFGSGETSDTGETADLWGGIENTYIQIPEDMAGQVYQNVKQGMPIVIYNE